MSENQSGNVFAGFLLGAAVGAGLALLLAPASGEETRRKLGETANRFKEGAGGKISDLKDALGDKTKDVGAAIEAGRDVFRRSSSPEEPAVRRST